MENQLNYFKLFSNCVLVKGVCKSLILDLQFHKYFEIENELYNVLQKNIENSFTIVELKKQFKYQFDEGIDSFFNYFKEKNLGFFTDEPRIFPKLEIQWYSPSKITNAVIEFSNLSNYDLIDLIYQLENLGCTAIELRFKDEIPLEVLENILIKTELSRIIAFFIFIKDFEALNIEGLSRLKQNYPRIAEFIVHSCKTADVYSKNQLFDLSFIRFTEYNLNSKLELKNKRSFVINIDSYSEATSYNLGLNKKVSINEFSEIKNYISHEKVYGNLEKNKIFEIISTIEFQVKWGIGNDKIEICKDCQFKYSCVDNSDIIKQNNKFFKVESCNYNPIKNIWFH